MTNSGKASHIGSSLSIADVLAVLYGVILNVKPKNPKWSMRDRFILSKGHAGAALYAVLAEKGFFSKELLNQYYQNGSVLSGHVSHKGVPGVEFSTGSLGHGLGIAAGMSYAAKIDNKEHRYFVVMSDGECDEGSNWEAILFAAHHRLSKLCVVVDYNKLQSDMTPSCDIINFGNLAAKFEAFGWDVYDVDGHDIIQLVETLEAKHQSGKPKMIVANTTKGKGVSFMENNNEWHHNILTKSKYELALAELEG